MSSCGGHAPAAPAIDPQVVAELRTEVDMLREMLATREATIHDLKLQLRQEQARKVQRPSFFSALMKPARPATAAADLALAHANAQLRARIQGLEVNICYRDNALARFGGRYSSTKAQLEQMTSSCRLLEATNSQLQAELKQARAQQEEAEFEHQQTKVELEFTQHA
jgi:multidrug resistance efflux pump